MPSISQKQHNAMEAAAHGKSTLGIPKSVGSDFVNADSRRNKMSSEGMKETTYAEGGPVLGRTRDFMKEPSPFRSSTDGLPPINQTVGKGGEPTSSYPKKGKGEQGRDKSMKAIMPKS